MPSPSVSRRSFLAGAGAVALAACGSGGKSTTSSKSSREDFVLAQLFSSDALVPGVSQRLPYALFDKQGAFLPKPPANLAFTVVDPNLRPVAEPITVASHDEGLPRPYYPLVLTP